MEDREVTITIKSLEEIKKQEREKAMSETKGHYKMSDETKQALKGLERIVEDKFDFIADKVKEGFDLTHKKLDYTNGCVKENTKFRLMTEGQLTLIKFLIATFGFSSIASLILTLIKK